MAFRKYKLDWLLAPHQAWTAASFNSANAFHGRSTDFPPERYQIFECTPTCTLDEATDNSKVEDTIKRLVAALKREEPEALTRCIAKVNA